MLMGNRYGKSLFAAAASMLVLGAPFGAAHANFLNRLGVERPSRRTRRQTAVRSELAFPSLNRAKRHPPAQSYKHAAEISFALGFRTSGVR